jgi:hypothetical protein
MHYISIKNISPILLREDFFMDKHNLPASYLSTNPSMHIDQQGEVSILVRCVNYRRYPYNYFVMHHDKTISKTKLLKGKIEENKLLNLNNFEDYNIEYQYNIPQYHTEWLGLEDIRFINEKDILVIIPECNPHGKPSLFKAILEKAKIHSFIPCYPNHREKNWMPYSDNDCYDYVIYKSYPFQIKKIVEDEFLDIQLQENILYDELKGYNGSTNGVKYKGSNQRLFLIHLNGEKTKHRFIIYNIISHQIYISKEFSFFKHTYIEFPISLCEYNCRYFISMGVDDNKAYIVEITEESIDEIFNI